MADKSKIKVTFDDLGIPFPLFAGSVDEAAQFVGISDCSVCGAINQYCFELGIGADIIISCPKCGNENAFVADEPTAKRCNFCNATLEFPIKIDGPINACYSCLRSGNAALTQDTELGMIRWQDAITGMTHGIPGLQHPDFVMVPTNQIEADGTVWTRAIVPQEDMFELLRTPSWISWQGESWTFHCKRPMVFIGVWSQADFEQNSPDGDGKTFFETVVRDQQPNLWEGRHGEPTYYAFRCQVCSETVVTWDMT